MAALHWEARRKQTVVDNQIESQRRLMQRQDKTSKDLYDKGKIMKVAEELSRDIATPMTSTLFRSQAQLLKSNREKSDDECRHKHSMDSRQMAKEMNYSAKLNNRYSSVNYVQQY